MGNLVMNPIPLQDVILEFDFFYMGMKIQDFISQKQNKVAII